MMTHSLMVKLGQRTGGGGFEESGVGRTNQARNGEGSLKGSSQGNVLIRVLVKFSVLLYTSGGEVDDLQEESSACIIRKAQDRKGKTVAQIVSCAGLTVKKRGLGLNKKEGGGIMGRVLLLRP